MIWRLISASMAQRPGRTALFQVGYALGVGVTLALLSIGTALLEQSRDEELFGGGDVLVLPAGLDLETFKTGGVSSLYFRIDQAPYLYRELLTSPRYESEIAAVAPWIADALLYVRVGDEAGSGEPQPIAASGQIPSRAASLGVSPSLLGGRWDDVAADRQWSIPEPAALYHEIDAFHMPYGAAVGDSTWAEWHYFNVRLPDRDAWLYLTYMVAGAVPDGQWGGRMLATLVGSWDRRAAASERVFEDWIEPERVRFSTRRADLRIGSSTVTVTPEGRYRLTASVPGPAGDTLRVDLVLAAPRPRYLPPLELSDEAFPSGYTVPLLSAEANGRVCDAADCTEVVGAKAYHDHNWGLWRDVTWDWGQLNAGGYSLLYGGVLREGEPVGSRFAFVVDDDGFAGLLPIRGIRYQWSDSAGGAAGGDSGRAYPVGFELTAARGDDRLVLRVRPEHVRATPAADSSGRVFYQMQGQAELEGVVGGLAVRETGTGFFETWRSEIRGPVQ
jgi:hypothetical protein